MRSLQSRLAGVSIREKVSANCSKWFCWWTLVGLVLLFTLVLHTIRSQKLNDMSIIRNVSHGHLTAPLTSDSLDSDEVTQNINADNDHSDLDFEVDEKEMDELEAMKADDEDGNAVFLGITPDNSSVWNGTSEMGLTSAIPMGESSLTEDTQNSSSAINTTTVLSRDECAVSRRKENPGLHGGSWLQYVHIPKTGGSSIQYAFSKLKPVKQGEALAMLFNGHTIRNSSSACPKRVWYGSILMGHRGFGYCSDVEHHPNRKLVTFATLREPMSMIVSLFDFNFARAETHFVSIFGRQKRLKELIKEYNNTPEMERGEAILRHMGRWQTLFMCGYHCLGADAPQNANLTDEYILDRAKQNILRTDVLGISDELNRVLVQLRFHSPRLHLNSRWPELNTAQTHKSVLDAEASAILKEWAEMDRALYDFAMPVYHAKQALAERCMLGGR